MIKYKRLIGYSLLVLCLVAVIGTATHSHPPSGQKTEALPTSTPAPTQPALRQDAQVVTVMQSLGLDYSKLNLVYEQPPNSPDGTEGMFVTPNTIYLTPGAIINSTDTVISHEYIHYIQHDVDPTGAQSYYPYLTQLETSDTWLHNRMAWHRDHYCNASGCSIQLEPEYEAIACTEMPDRALHADFVAWCNTYLPKRSAIIPQ